MLSNPILMENLGRLEQDRRLREAEQDRLVQQARAVKGKQISSGRALAWLGKRLIAWGQNLRRRSGFELDARALAVATPCQPC